MLQRILSSSIDGHLNLRESLYTQTIIWVGTILDHIDFRVSLPSYQGLYMVWKRFIDVDGIEIKNSIRYPYPISMKKNVKTML